MTINAVGIICPACGEETWFLGTVTWRPTWLGYTQTITHVCGHRIPSVHYLLLYDQDMNFVAIIPGADQFIDSAGQPVYMAGEVEDIPF